MLQQNKSLSKPSMSILAIKGTPFSIMLNASGIVMIGVPLSDLTVWVAHPNSLRFTETKPSVDPIAARIGIRRRSNLAFSERTRKLSRSGSMATT